MDLWLKDRVSIVTGGGWGIGKATALTFAEEGARVVIADMDETRGESAAEEIRSKGGQSIFTNTDVSKWESAVNMVNDTLKAFGQIDVLVNNAGAFRTNFFMKMTREDWKAEIDVNFYGVLNCVRAVLEHMIERKSGCIINVSSDAGRVGEPNQPVYSGTKGAVIAFSKAIAKDVSRYSIRVNSVCPSLTIGERRLEVEKDLREDPEKWKAYEEWKQSTLRLYPLRRFNEPQDLANTIVYLASERSCNIHGQTISINAGYCMP
ncbi:MAG: SDR family NAD(P)-dependent oxidoreductase [Thermodesulfobacteriota bacterium]